MDIEFFIRIVYLCHFREAWERENFFFTGRSRQFWHVYSFISAWLWSFTSRLSATSIVHRSSTQISSTISFLIPITFFLRWTAIDRLSSLAFNSILGNWTRFSRSEMPRIGRYLSFLSSIRSIYLYRATSFSSFPLKSQWLNIPISDWPPEW